MLSKLENRVMKVIYSQSEGKDGLLISPTDIARQAGISGLKLQDVERVINDLYSLTSTIPTSYRSDGVHFYTPGGTELIGGKVLSVICSLLDIEAQGIDINVFESEHYSKNNIGF